MGWDVGGCGLVCMPYGWGTPLVRSPQWKGLTFEAVGNTGDYA